MPQGRLNDRRCIATGAPLGPDARALRFVRSPEGEAVPDLALRLPGRGAWVSAQRSAVEAAVRRNAFSRAFKAPTAVPEPAEGFAARIEALLAERALSRLGLARKAGALFAGFEAVRERLPGLCAYLSPADAAEDGVNKIVARLAATSPATHIRLPATSEAVSAAIGEVGAVHLGLAAGGAGRAAAEAAAVWAAYTENPPAT